MCRGALNPSGIRQRHSRMRFSDNPVPSGDP